MLEQRHTMKLLWVEPWKACSPEGNELNAHLELRATVHVCINMSRAAAKQAGRPTTGEDARHLLDFMSVHWATPDLQWEENARALLKLALELAYELRSRCDDPLHDEQIKSLRTIETEWATSTNFLR